MEKVRWREEKQVGDKLVKEMVEENCIYIFFLSQNLYEPVKF
jgi:hypothetical protein